MTDLPDTNISLKSLVKREGELELALARERIPSLGDDEVLVKVVAAPINPTDQFLLFAGADLSAAKRSQREGLPVLTAPVPAGVLRLLAGRLDTPMQVGSEGSGIVVNTGASEKARALRGKTVAAIGDGMFTQYRVLSADLCMVLPDGTDPRDGASAFINPLTALGFVETAKVEGHSAIVHTAAASNLGQMLNRICIADGIPLVNIVRKDEHVVLLKAQGAQHVLNSDSPEFRSELIDAVAETGATVAFDAIAGGKLGGEILAAIEAVARSRMTTYSRYGSDVFKQLYIYGGLDPSPTILSRGQFGFGWSASGWLLFPFLRRAGGDVARRLRARVVAELHTTFASSYSHEISLAEAIDPDIIAAYLAKRTGEKYLITP